MSHGKVARFESHRYVDHAERIFRGDNVLRHFWVSDNKHLHPALWVSSNYQSAEFLLASFCADDTLSCSLACNSCCFTLQRQSLFHARYKRLLGLRRHLSHSGLSDLTRCWSILHGISTSGIFFGRFPLKRRFTSAFRCFGL